jgi:hypothetical protein
MKVFVVINDAEDKVEVFSTKSEALRVGDPIECVVHKREYKARKVAPWEDEVVVKD